MVLQRQGSGTPQVGIAPPMNGDQKLASSQRPPGLSRMYDNGRSDQGGLRSGSSSRNYDLGAVLGKSPLRFVKGKRLQHSGKGLSCSTSSLLLLCLFVVFFTIFSSQAINRAFSGERASSQLDDVFSRPDPLKTRTRSEYTQKQKGSVVEDEQISGSDNLGRDTSDLSDDHGSQDDFESQGDQDHINKTDKDPNPHKDAANQDVQKKQQSGSLYNERGRDELVEYAAQYEEEKYQDGEGDSSTGQGLGGGQKDGLNKLQPDEDEYDDDGGEEEPEKRADVVDSSEDPQSTKEMLGVSVSDQTSGGDSEDPRGTGSLPKQETSEVHRDEKSRSSLEQDKGDGDVTELEKVVTTQQSGAQKFPKGRKKSRHSPTPACEINFLSTTEGLQEPQGQSAYANFSLSYVQREERPVGSTNWAPKFGGHQTLGEREESFIAKDQTVHCGFVKSPEGEPWTGFELNESDVEFLSTCHIAVSSCIFGAWDHLRTPTNKKMSSSSKEKVCFVMFVDQKSLDVILKEGPKLNEKGSLGLWKLVLIKNLPYQDGRRNGKVPKFLTHRLFPNARYSIWLDSKLRLHADPLLILEHFLWRGKHEYAISNHYDRHCVWEEVAQNKKLNKFNHTIIDEQFQFYQRDGLTRFNGSDPHRLLPSHVPEGSFIVRAHTPMSNLFSCLWFNEVERFTPRDQLSFAYTYLKLARTNPTMHFRLNMFKDCERKAMAKLYHHRLEAITAVTNFQ